MTDDGKVLFLPTKAHLGHLKEAKRQLSREILEPVRVSAFRAAQAATSPDLHHNVVGVGVGEKIAQRRHTGVLAVKVLVRRKYAENEVPAGQMLPKVYHGMPVDVVQTGTFRSFEALAISSLPDPRSRKRPVQPGSSVGFESPRLVTGTFGLLVERGGRRFILSNSHVLAAEGRLEEGAPIFQPGLLDEGDPARDQVATLTQSVPFRTGKLNRVDAAIAEIDPGISVSRSILFLGAPQRKAARAQRDMIVHKFGRTTGYSVGRVISLDTDVSVDYESGTFMFQDQILIEGVNGEPFSAAGDSGSAILERGTNRPVGLLFAGTPTHTLANPLDQVLKRLKVTLV
jgi:hypothetical protein